MLSGYIVNMDSFHAPKHSRPRWPSSSFRSMARRDALLSGSNPLTLCRRPVCDNLRLMQPVASGAGLQGGAVLRHSGRQNRCQPEGAPESGPDSAKTCCAVGPKPLSDAPTLPTRWLINSLLWFLPRLVGSVA